MRRIVAGRYELLAEIGSGGMGTVYRARDRRTGTIVAVKLLHSHLAQDRHYIERFRREAQIAKSMDSAYIVKVSDVGDHDGGPFIVMEYVPGSTLREVLEARRRFSPQPALALCLQIVEALREASRKGVVHRDVKPQNIIVTPEGLAKVADFGVAKAEELSTLTLSGSFFGTLQYAAPERFEGEGDIRSDIYSVGIILYQMLTGAVPFAADSALALIRLHSEQPPAPLSQHVPDAPSDVQALVSRCLAKSPAGRFQSPDALANAISSLLPAADAKATLARIQLPKRRSGLRAAVSRWWAGHRRLARTALGAGAVAVIAAGLGLGAAWVFRGVGSDSEGPTALDPWAFRWAGLTTPSGVVVGETEECLASAERIAYVGEDGDVWFVDSDGTSATPVTESGNNSELAFSPDGRKLAYVHETAGDGQQGVISEIRVVSGDTTFDESVLPTSTLVKGVGLSVGLDNLRWTTDGASVLAHVYLGGVSQHYIGAFPVDSTLEPYFLGGPGGNPTTRPGEVQVLAYGFDVHPVSGEIAFVMHSNADPFGYYLSVAEPDGSNGRYSLPRYVLLPPGAQEPSYLGPSWSPVSQDIALYVDRQGTYSLAAVGSNVSTLMAAPKELATIGPGRPTDRPRWSSDGKWLAYDDGAAIWVVDAAGETTPRELADGTHPTWSPDGSKVAYESEDGIWVIPTSGGEPRMVASGSAPEWSPDASVCDAARPATQIAYAVEYGAPSDPTSASFSIRIVDSGIGESRLLARNVWYPRDMRWSLDGQEIALCTPGASGRLWVMRSDATEARELGARCGSGVWSPDGMNLAVAAPSHMAQSDIFVINRDGTGSVNLTDSVDEFNVEPGWSPDGQHLVFRKAAPNGDASQAGDLYVVSADGSELIQLTNDELTESAPQWSPRDDVIVYSATPKGALMGPETGVYVVDLDRKEPRKLRDRSMLPRWSPDGSHIAYVRLTDEETPEAELRVMDAAGETDVRIAGPLAGSSSEWCLHDWSPDGKQLAFVLDQVGGMDLFVANIDGTGLTRITNDLSTKRGLAWGPPGAPKELAGEPLDFAPYGLLGTSTPTSSASATPMFTATPAPAADARSVPIESLLRPGAEVQKVLYASLDETPPEEIVVYSDMTLMQGETECGPVPFLEVFAYDSGRDQWNKVFDASEGEGPLIPVQLEDYQEGGAMCALIWWIDPLELMDFDGDGRHELALRVLGGGGSGNPGYVKILGFEGVSLDLRATRLFQAQLWKAQDVVVAGEGELWLEQVITSKWEPVGHAAAALRGVVRYDKNQEEITIVEEEARLLCTEGTVTAKTEDLLTLSCESNELPGLMDPYPAELDFLVDQYTRFYPEPAVSSLDDIQIDDYVRVEVATLGLSAGGVAVEWGLRDEGWVVPGWAFASPVASRIEVVSAP